MGRRQVFLLLLVLSFASFVSAQTVSITFLDDWGAPATRLLEHGKALLRVIDPAANTSPGRDSVAVDLMTTNAMDTDFTNLLETGEATGVFEGEVDLTTDFYLNYLEDEDHLLTYPQNYPPEALDTAAAAYNGVSTAVEAAPSLTDLLDESGTSPAGFVPGETVRVRVRDQYADKNVGMESTLATLSLSGGGSEILVLVETGGDTGVFETSFRLQAAVGETITVTHSDANGFSSSSDSAAVTAATVRLIDQEGRPTDVYVEDSDVIVRVIHPAANLNGSMFDTVTAGAFMQLSGDSETMTLRETGRDTGVFEGKMDLSSGYVFSGNQRLDSLAITGPNAPFDTVSISYASLTDSAGITGSITRLFDTEGQELGSLPLNSILRIRVETFNDSGFIDSTFVEVRSLTTNDVETLELRETGPFSNVFEGEIEVFWSPAPGSGDGFLGASVNDTVRVDHFDANGYTRSRAEATAVRSSVRFVDEDGEPVSVLLEGSTARVRVHDRVSQPNPPPTLVESLLGRDSEDLSLVSVFPGAHLFEGSIPLDIDNYYGTPNDGELTINGNTNPVNQPDLVTATSYDASAEAVTAPALLEWARPVEAAGALLSLRARAPLANLSPAYPNYLMVQVRSKRGGDSRSLYLNETGADTAVFEGTIRALTEYEYASDTLYVYPSDTVTAFFNSYYEMGGAAATVEIVPSLLELVDGEGEPVSAYLFGETVHVRLADVAANADPVTAEILPGSVQAWRRGDDRPDVEYVDLVETGPDTGVFTGSLPTSLVHFMAFPYFDNGDLELLDIYPPYGDVATITATHGDVSDTARMEDSVVRITNAAGDDWPVVVIGSQAHVWLRRPAGNTTAGVDSETVELWTHDSPNDFEALTLVETGPDTGIFRGSIPVAQGTTPTLDDGTLQGQPGITVQVDKRVTVTIRSVDTALIAQLLFFPPEAQDDFATTDEGVPVTIPVTANDDDPDGDDIGVIEVTQGTKGSVTFTSGGASVTYTPNAGATGSDSFTYTVADFGGNVDGNTDTATVFVTINSLNNAPNAVDDSATTDEETPVNVAVKANDSDPEGDPLTVSAADGGANGSSVIEADGTVTYTPNVDFRGMTSFGYTISDGNGGTASATVSVYVSNVNDPPVAVDDSATTNEDASVNFPVKNNDSDPDGDSFSVVSVTQGAKGSVVINNSPGAFHWLIYTPNANANGSDTVTYTIADSNGGTDTATVAITINPVNDAPDAVTDSVTTPEDTPFTIDPRTNDSDVDGNPLTITSVNGGTRGTPVLNANGTITYTPNANVSGSDFIQYHLSDGNGGTDSALVNITITAVNDPPNANNDLPLVTEDTPLAIAVLSNDNDPENNVLTITSYTQPTKGTAVLNADKTITYSPNLNANGTDSFNYTVSDGNGGTDTATVNISIIPVNDPPVANADTATVAEEGTVNIPVLANDTDAENSTLTLVSVTQGAHGTVTIVTGQARYQPAANYAGPDTFTYVVRDPANQTATGTVNVTVTPVNDPPVANADSAATNEDTPVAVSVLANDTDVDGDTLTVSAVTQSANGSVATNGTTVTFTPAANWSGNTAFTYTIRDAGLVERTATVTVTVNPVNDPPLAGPDTAETNEDVAVTVSVLANDADIDGGALSVTSVTQGSDGAVTTNGVTVTYTPEAGFFGTDSFTYNLSDGVGGTATGLVTITVHEVDGAPVAAPDSATTREGVAVIIPVLANDTDPNGGTLTVTSVGSPGVLLPDGTVQYTPGANFTGTVNFAYTISDGQGETANGQVTVVVGEALERVAVLATNSVAIRSGADVLSGDVIVNQAGAGPFLNGAELSVGGSVTTAANWDVEADSLNVALLATVASDVSYNQLTNLGTISGQQRTPLALPVFPTLPAFLTATPGTSNVNVGTNGTTTLAPGSYQDLVVGRKGTVNFTGGTYHFRSITVDREAKLFFAAASVVRVQQKLSTKTQTTVGPATGASIDASSIVFYVGGINGTTGALSATPKAVEIGTNNLLTINLYAPNGTAWLQDGTVATGAFFGKDVDLGNVQVTLDSAFN